MRFLTFDGFLPSTQPRRRGAFLCARRLRLSPLASLRRYFVSTPARHSRCRPGPSESAWAQTGKAPCEQKAFRFTPDSDRRCGHPGSASPAPRSRPQSRTGSRACPTPAAAFPRSRGLRSRPTQAAHSAAASFRSRSATRRSTPQKPIRSPPTTSWRGGDDYTSLRDIEPVLPVSDSPTIAYEVIDYIASIGTIRTGAAGRIVVK